MAYSEQEINLVQSLLTDIQAKTGGHNTLTLNDNCLITSIEKSKTKLEIRVHDTTAIAIKYLYKVLKNA